MKILGISGPPHKFLRFCCEICLHVSKHEEKAQNTETQTFCCGSSVVSRCFSKLTTLLDPQISNFSEQFKCFLVNEFWLIWLCDVHNKLPISGCALLKAGSTRTFMCFCIAPKRLTSARRLWWFTVACLLMCVQMCLPSHTRHFKAGCSSIAHIHR